MKNHQTINKDEKSAKYLNLAIARRKTLH